MSPEVVVALLVGVPAIYYTYRQLKKHQKNLDYAYVTRHYGPLGQAGSVSASVKLPDGRVINPDRLYLFDLAVTLRAWEDLVSSNKKTDSIDVSDALGCVLVAKVTPPPHPVRVEAGPSADATIAGWSIYAEHVTRGATLLISGIAAGDGALRIRSSIPNTNVRRATVFEPSAFREVALAPRPRPRPQSATSDVHLILVPDIRRMARRLLDLCSVAAIGYVAYSFVADVRGRQNREQWPELLQLMRQNQTTLIRSVLVVLALLALVPAWKALKAMAPVLTSALERALRFVFSRQYKELGHGVVVTSYYRHVLVRGERDERSSSKLPKALTSAYERLVDLEESLQTLLAPEGKPEKASRTPGQARMGPKSKPLVMPEVE